MVIRLFNLSKWRKLPAGEVIQFHGEHERKVRIEFNTEHDCRLDIVHDRTDMADATFLAAFKGRETVEFTAKGGTFLMATSEGEVWVHHDDGDVHGTDRKEVPFTKLMGRRSRSDQLERMLQIQQNAYERLLAEQEVERQQWEARLANADPETGEVTDDETDPAGDGDSGNGADAEPVVRAEPAADGSGDGPGASGGVKPQSAKA